MNWLDLVIVIVCGLSAFYGFRVGLLQMLVPLVLVVAGLALSSRISESLGNIFSSFSSSESTQTIMAFFAMFLVIAIGSFILSQLLRAALGFIPSFGMANGLAGIVAGLAIGFVVLSGIFTGVRHLPMGNAGQTIEKSTLGSFLSDNFGVVMKGAGLLPVDWDAKVEGLKGSLPENIPTSMPDLPPGLPQSIPELFPGIRP